MAAFTLRSLNLNANCDPERAERLARELLRSEAGDDSDVILLQEVPGPLIDALQDSGGPWQVNSWMMSGTQADSATKMGLATLARRSAERVAYVEFDNPRLSVDRDGDRLVSHDKGALVTCIGLGPSGAPVIVANVHGLPFTRFDVAEDDDLVADIWGSFEARLRAKVDVGKDGYFALAGDFNLEDRSPIERAFTTWSLSPTFKERPTRPSGRRTDDVYLASGLSLKMADLRDVGSDHFELRASIALSGS